MVHDIFFMRKALNQAQKAYFENEVPVGAVIVQDGIVIAQAYNQVEQKKTQLAHAEMQVLAQVAGMQWRLQDCIVFVTLQPCMMCMGALLLSRVQCIVWGASSPVYGVQIPVYDIPAIYTQSTKLYGGILQDEVQELMQKFFEEQRKKSSED